MRQSMKRSTPLDPNTPLDTVHSTLERLSVDHDLQQEINIQRSNLIQEFPFDLLVTIFSKVNTLTPTPEKITILFWLQARTVSKSWHSAISKMDFSQAITSVPNCFNIPQLLEIFDFSQLSINRPVDPSLLTKLTGITLHLHDEYHRYAKNLILFTRLKILHIRTIPDSFSGSLITLPDKVLLGLTNLESLTLEKIHNATDIHTLTNLTSLKLLDSPGLTQAHTDSLSKLTDITSSNPSFFRKGRGTGHHRRCFFPGPTTVYKGDYLDGRRHGHGSCCQLYGDGGSYVGEWVNDVRHGNGRMNFKRGGYYEGDWQQGRVTGQGYVISHTGDSYDGSWTNGRRDGYGVYTRPGFEPIKGFWEHGKLISQEGNQPMFSDLASIFYQLDTEGFDDPK